MHKDTEKTSELETLSSPKLPPPKKTGIFSLLGVVIAIVASLYALYSVYQIREQLANTTEVNGQLTELSDRQNKQEESLSRQSQDNRENDKQIQTLRQELQTLKGAEVSQDSHWLLLKARYYLELAQINTHWTTDYNTSMALTAEADKLLAEVHGVELLTLRQSIAKEMNELKAIPVMDVVGILSQLDALQKQLNTLSVHKALEEPKAATAATPGTKDWRAHLQNSLKALEKVVVIRKDSDNLALQLSPLLESAVKESIRLNLQQAEWAVLHNKPAVFQLALQQAIQQLQLRFSPDSKPLVDQLTGLQSIPWTQAKPPESAALGLLDKILQTPNKAPEATP